ncbi:MAG: hypothetical protein IJY39_06685 [Clostridia bacterium]|nr:hypothetical protein [Clostridia bacterium]
MTYLFEEYYKRGVVVCDRPKTSIYARRIVEALGIDGAIRVSPMHCHGREDIDRFLDITREIGGYELKPLFISQTNYYPN